MSLGPGDYQCSRFLFWVAGVGRGGKGGRRGAGVSGSPIVSTRVDHYLQAGVEVTSPRYSIPMSLAANTHQSRHKDKRNYKSTFPTRYNEETETFSQSPTCTLQLAPPPPMFAKTSQSRQHPSVRYGS